MCACHLMFYVTYNKLILCYLCMEIINIKSPEIDDEEIDEERDQLMVMVNRSSGFTPIPDTGLFNA